MKKKTDSLLKRLSMDLALIMLSFFAFSTVMAADLDEIKQRGG
jgi:hypothetical protein